MTQQAIEQSGIDTVTKTRSGSSSCPRQLVIFVAVMGLLPLCLTGCTRDPKVRAEKSYARAEKYLHEKKPDAAAIELRRALQLDPQLAKAHYLLGTVELERGDVLQAFREFVATTAADPDNKDAELMVSELLARAHNYTQAKREAQSLLSRWPGEKTATLLLAESDIGLQDFKQGMVLVNEVLASDPNNVRGLQDLALLQVQQGNVALAQSTLRRAWQIDPKAPLAVALLSTTYELQRDSQNAETVLKEALAQNPGNLDFLSMMAEFYMRSKRYGEAEPLYRQIQAASKDQSRLRGVLAEFYLHSSRIKDAETEYKRLVKEDDKDWQSWQGLAVTYVAENQLDEASNVLDRILKSNPKSWEALGLKGRILLERGQAVQATPLLQQAHKSQPEVAEPAFDLARAYIAQGKLPEAQTALQDVIKVNPNYQGALTLLAALNLQGGRVDQAIQDLNRDQGQGQNSVDRSFLLSEAYAQKGDYQLAESQLQGVLNSTDPQKRLLLLQSLASIKLAQKQYGAAASLATQALDQSPRLATALFTLGMSYVDQKQPDKGIQEVKSRIDKMPDWATGYQVLGQVAQQGGRLTVAMDAYNQALRIDPKLSAAALSLGDTYLLNKQSDLARQQFEKAAQLQNARSYAMARLGQIYETQGNIDKARSSYESSLAADPDNVLAKNNLAWLYAEHGGNIDEALKLAEEAKEKSPEDPTITDTLGWIYVKKGSYQAAVDNLQNSVAKNPHDASGLYHLGTAYYLLGRHADAKRELQAALKLPDFNQAAEAKKMLAEMASK